ncbi:MAG: hypothetical protein HY360_13890 [Verrucomicrobia bacterium]|nr:hypothetical protein [Verrucomicrobiota bacterium]
MNAVNLHSIHGNLGQPLASDFRNLQITKAPIATEHSTQRESRGLDKEKSAGSSDSINVLNPVLKIKKMGPSPLPVEFLNQTIDSQHQQSDEATQRTRAELNADEPSRGPDRVNTVA